MLFFPHCFYIKWNWIQLTSSNYTVLKIKGTSIRTSKLSSMLLGKALFIFFMSMMFQLHKLWTPYSSRWLMSSSAGTAGLWGNCNRTDSVTHTNSHGDGKSGEFSLALNLGKTKLQVLTAAREGKIISFLIHGNWDIVQNSSCVLLKPNFPLWCFCFLNLNF